MLAELHTGYVLFQNDSVSTMLSRITGILGNFPLHVLGAGRETHKYFTPNNIVYDRDEDENYLLIFPKKTNLRDRVHLPSKLSMDEELFLDFLYQMLDLDPEQRLTASEALQHPWLADADSVYVSEYIIQPPKVAAGAFSNRDDNDDFEDVYNGEEDEDDEDDDDNYEDYDDDVNDQRFQSNYETDIDNPATYLDDEDDDGVGLHDVGSVDADDSPEKNASKM